MQASTLAALLLSATLCLSTPLTHQKRYDLDGNGVPDMCCVKAGVAHCLGDNGQWSAVSATGNTVTTWSSPVASLVVTTTPPAATTKVASALPSLSQVHSVSGNRSSVSLKGNLQYTGKLQSKKLDGGKCRAGQIGESIIWSSGDNCQRNTVPATPNTVPTRSSLFASSPVASSPAASSPVVASPVASLVATTTPPAATTKVGAALPSPSQFSLDSGNKWSVSLKGELQYTGELQSKKLDGDKCRTGQIGDSIIWNCGDMECNGDPMTCGFSYGPAFYGTDSVMVVNTTNVVSVSDNNFLLPWSGDGTPTAPQTSWGMDTSNVAPINDTHGVAFAWEICRGAPDGSIVNKGNAVAWITLGDTKPIATRVGPLLTGPNVIALGLLAILRDGEYIYTYSQGGPSNTIVGRVLADNIFDAAQYEFLSFGSDSDWVPGIPESSTTTIGATTSDSGGKFDCGVYGSVFFSDYFQQYVIVCSIMEMYVNMYLSHTPYGPWSATYSLMSGATDVSIRGYYGTMVHPEYPVDNGFYMSMGPNSVFDVFEFNFYY